jgi:DNA repair protein RecO (recombination protein O)
MPAKPSSNTARVYPVDAIVLRRHSIGETDRVVTLFCREAGKLDAVVKGARGPRGRLGGATEPFTRISGLLARGQNLDLLTQAEVRNTYPQVRQDVGGMGCASYLVELVDAGLEERQPAGPLWALLDTALTHAGAAVSRELFCRAFELRAMALMGYEPQLNRCALDGAALEEAGLRFDAEHGGVICARCAARGRAGAPLRVGRLQALRTLAQAPLEQVAISRAPADLLRDLRRCLVPYVRHHLGQELRALQFVEEAALTGGAG